MILPILVTIFATSAFWFWLTEARVIEAYRQRDNAITSRDAFRSMLEHRDDRPAPKPEPVQPFVPVNRLASYFEENP